MKFIEWFKKSYLIVILFVVVLGILVIKININIKDNKTSEIPTITPYIENKIDNKTDNLSIPTPTITSSAVFGNKTRQEILQMDPEKRDDFITNLSQEENEELDMMPNYDFSDFLPITKQDFIVEKFDYQNKKITVKPLIQDITILKTEVDDWLYYETGNNPKKIEIIWNE
jgi:hypothetical protein